MSDDTNTFFYWFHIIPDDDERKAPVPYDVNIMRTSRMMRQLRKRCGSDRALNIDDVKEFLEEELHVNTKTHGFIDKRQTLHQLKAEAYTIELIQMYLHMVDGPQRCEIAESVMQCDALELLVQAIDISVRHKLPNGDYIEYAISECVNEYSERYSSHFFLKRMADYIHVSDDEYNADNLQYLLENTSRLRFNVEVMSIYYPDSNADEEDGVERLMQYTVPFADLPFSTDDITSDPGYEPGQCETPLGFIEKNNAPADITLLFLRYGAKSNLFADFYREICDPIASCPVSVHLDIEDLHDVYNKDTVISFEEVIDEAIIANRMRTLRYMLRADPYIHIHYRAMYRWSDRSNTDGVISMSYPGKGHHIDVRLRDHFLPPCLMESVPSLSRISRYVIRGVLIQNRQLPDGIRKLFIPELLKPYLDLMED